MIYIAVIGGSVCTKEEEAVARKVGEEVARLGGILVCGGGSGVMEAASKGSAGIGGLVLGILPDHDPRSGNAYLTAAIATGLGEARNAIITHTADVVIAIGGEYGTLSEIALALKMGKPVVGLNSWSLHAPRKIEGGIIEAEEAEEAVTRAFELAEG